MVRMVVLEDAAAIAGIYNHYVRNSTVTFEEDEVSVAEMEGRIREVREKYPWLVLEEEGQVLGYAYAGAWKSRCAYRYSVEVSVYLRQDLTGRGIGSSLFSVLLEKLKLLQVHGVIGGVALPNDACVALHHKFGFEQVARFREVGYKFDTWIDVAYFEKLL